MGALTSRQNAGVEEVDIVSNHAYKYPPKSGKFQNFLPSIRNYRKLLYVYDIVSELLFVCRSVFSSSFKTKRFQKCWCDSDSEYLVQYNDNILSMYTFPN